MINRNFVLGIGALGAAAFLVSGQLGAAIAAVPANDAPPVTVQFSSTYFSNIAGSSAAFAGLRGIKREDIVYDPTVLANLVEPTGGVTLFLMGQAGYDIHQRNSILDRERIDLQAGADTQLNVCDTTVTGSWGRHQSDVMDLSLGVTKNTQQNLSAELSATCNQEGQIVPSASISQTWATNSAFLYNGQDYHSFSANGSVAYKAGSFGAISLIGSYTQTAYPHRLFVVGFGPQSDGYNLYSGGLHYERAFGATIQFGASVSETSLSQNNGLGKGFSGITYDANISYNPTPRLSFTADVNRASTPSYYLNADYSVNQKYSGEVDYRLTSRLKAALGAVQTHNNFAGAALVAGTNILAQTYRSFYGSLAFNATPTFSVSLNAGQDQRHSDVVGYNYSGGHVGLALSKSF